MTSFQLSTTRTTTIIPLLAQSNQNTINTPLNCANKSSYFGSSVASTNLAAKKNLVDQTIYNNAQIPLEKVQAIQAKIYELEKQIKLISKFKYKSALILKFNFNNIKQKKINALNKFLNGENFVKEDFNAIKYVDSFGKSSTLRLLEKLELAKTSWHGGIKYFRIVNENGLGVETYTDGTRYEGHFAHGQKSGWGIEIYAVGTRVDSEIDHYLGWYSDFIPSHFVSYEGQWAKGQKSGWGICQYTCGSYKGQWANDLRNGWGEYDTYFDECTCPLGKCLWLNGRYSQRYNARLTDPKESALAKKYEAARIQCELEKQQCFIAKQNFYYLRILENTPLVKDIADIISGYI